jgi:hypothetical protein
VAGAHRPTITQSKFVAPPIDAVKARGYSPATVAMDRGYDKKRVFDETRERGCVPIIALRKGRAIPLTTIPYGSPEWNNLCHRRVAVEREFGRLKHDFALAAPRPWPRPRPASRRPLHHHAARHRSCAGASRRTRGLIR